MAMVDRDIKNARDILSVMSGDKELGKLAELREKALMDEISRINGAKEEGIKEVAKKLLDILDDKTISAKTGLDIELIKKLRIK